MDAESFIANTDNLVNAEFYLEPVLMGFKSHQEGRHIYEDQEYICIRVKGQQNQEVRRKATEEDKKRFAGSWAAFKAGEAVPITGTLLKHLPNITPAQIKTLNSMNVMTIEDLANLSDPGLHKCGMGARDLQNRAQRYLNGSGSTKVVEEQRNTINALLDRIEKLEASMAPKRKGRPPKQKEQNQPETTQ